MFREILTDLQQTLLELLSRIAEVRTFYLAGGTAIRHGACSWPTPRTPDPYHLLRSLTFFDDAEADAMPDLLVGVTWDEIKAFFRGEAARLFREL